MEIRQGCEPHVIYTPIVTYVRRSTLVYTGHRQRPDTFFWYAGIRIAYVEPNPWYTGPVTYQQIAI